MKFATLSALLMALVIVPACGNQPGPEAEPAASASPSSAQPARNSSHNNEKPAVTAAEPAGLDDQQEAPEAEDRSEGEARSTEAAARLPDAPAPAQKAAVPAPANKEGFGRNLVGSCRLYFSDDSVRCREIYGSSQARFIEIFIKHCQAGAGDYDGQWSESSCPLELAEKERVGGCMTEDPDYSTIAYSYIDPNDALAKGLVPLVRTQCLGTYIPER